MSEDPHLGRVLQGRYRVLERMSGGAMGAVYKAERLQLNRQVAVKFLKAAGPQMEQMRQRFEVEARAMGRLAHPNCISVIDFGVEHVPYLVMELITGQNLREVVAGGPLPIARALNIARQILAGLQHAHAQGIVHRDIKPENIVLQSGAGLDDHVRILDFGLAKLMDHSSELTVGLALGTPNYMAPEQAQEGGIDERADLYATAILLFEMVTGRLPFQSENVGELLRQQLNDAPPRLSQAKPDLKFPAGLEELVHKAMAKKPGERFPSALAMGNELDAIISKVAARSTSSTSQAAKLRDLTIAIGSGAAPNLPPPGPGGIAHPPPAPPRAAGTVPSDATIVDSGAPIHTGAAASTAMDADPARTDVSPRERTGPAARLAAYYRRTPPEKRRLIAGVGAGVLLLLLTVAVVSGRGPAKGDAAANEDTAPATGVPKPGPSDRASRKTTVKTTATTTAKASAKTTATPQANPADERAPQTRPAGSGTGDRWAGAASASRPRKEASRPTSSDRWGGRWKK